MKNPLLSIIFIFLFIGFANSQEKMIDPSFEEVISLKSPGTPIISPDGNHVAYTQRTTDWKENRYDNEIWLSKNLGRPFQLTNTTKGNSGTIRWSPDSKWIGFLADRGNKSQIYIIQVDGGEAIAITNEERGVNDFEWSPDGKKFAFTSNVDKEKDTKEREKKFGKYAVEDEEYTLTELLMIKFNEDDLHNVDLPEYAVDTTARTSSKATKLIESPDYSIRGFRWSPDGSKIVIQHQNDPLINSFFSSDISILDVDSKELELLVSNPSFDGFIDWSPDGNSILYESSVENKTSNFYKNDRYFRIDLNGKNNKELASGFNENIYGMTWTVNGIYGSAYQKTKRNLLILDPKSGEVNLLKQPLPRIYGFSINKSSEKIAYQGESDNSLREIFVSNLSELNATRLTDYTSQFDNWKVAQSEVVSWKSEDGAIIEGILHKPMDYDPGKKYPLLVVIHGGPTGVDRPTPVPGYVYPVIQWLNKGALVLRPNYRGSAGYGEEFRALNVRNLGVGDAWDVQSGVEYLNQLGIIDKSKIGAMGWSQGGYISAFLSTNSTEFQAISVGAGISDWMTYYVNTDIHPFTRQYLEATPWSDPEIYARTSPMTNINKAVTPTLIQHGEFDKRVPIPNAYQLYQGLQDKGVESKLIVYKGFGHGINKPKERLAATYHNWKWFGKYIWGESEVNGSSEASSIKN